MNDFLICYDDVVSSSSWIYYIYVSYSSVFYYVNEISNETIHMMMWMTNEMKCYDDDVEISLMFFFHDDALDPPSPLNLYFDGVVVYCYHWMICFRRKTLLGDLLTLSLGGIRWFPDRCHHLLSLLQKSQKAVNVKQGSAGQRTYSHHMSPPRTSVLAET